AGEHARSADSRRDSERRSGAAGVQRNLDGRSARCTAGIAQIFCDIGGGVWLLLASIGIYGLLAYMLGQRSREIGIRMALGARRNDILRMFLGKGVALAGVGIVAGLVVSASTASMMASLLYGVRPRDPAVFLIVPMVLLAVAALASYLPARRATKVNPIIALGES